MYRTHLKWMEEEGIYDNMVDGDDNTLDTTHIDESTYFSCLINNTDITSLLVSDLNLAGDNTIVKNLIADVLNSIADNV